MTGQQGAPGQGGPPIGDQEATQVGMPVPPPAPGVLRQDPLPAYPQQPPPPPPPGYAPGPPPGHGQPAAGYGAPPGGYTPPPGYGYAPPPPARGDGFSPIVVGLVVLLLVVGLGVGGMYVAHIGPFAPPASTTPTLIANATPTPTPSRPPATATPTVPATTAPPTLAPTTAPATTAPPTLVPTTAPATATPTVPPSSPSTADEEVLRSHVPAAFVDSCTTTPVTDPALAGVICFANDGTVVVNYSLYPDENTMREAYDSSRQLFASDAGSASCSDSENWPSAYDYTIGGEPAGSVFCADFFGFIQMYWTDTRFKILSWASKVAGTRDELYTFWLEDSGPY